MLAIFTGLHFDIILGHFGNVQAAAFLLCLAVLATFRRLHFYYPPAFWPCLGGCIFVIFGCFGYVQAAAFLLSSAVMAMFRWVHFYYLPPFLPCSGACILIIFGLFGHA